MERARLQRSREACDACGLAPTGTSNQFLGTKPIYLLFNVSHDTISFMEKNFDSNGHAVFSLNYHLIVVVKYRRKALFSADVLARMREICEYVGKSHFLEIREMNGEADHVHFLLRTKPHTDLCKYINAMKSATSRLLKKEYPQIRRIVYGDALWSPSYFICTVGGAPLDVLKRYIEQQGSKEVHRK